MDNHYEKTVFLSGLFEKPDYQANRQWKAHQEMQIKFLLSKGLASSCHFLDVGCGPMRLGVKVIPLIKTGWYYGVDINQDTLDLGRKVLLDHDVNSQRFTLIQTKNFELDDVDKPIDIAFSNSLFSHLSLNSIRLCLTSVRRVLSENGVYYSTFFNIDEALWPRPADRNKWGRVFATYPNSDPYHYSEQMLRDLAKNAGFSMALDDDFGHPTQTMACFRPCS